MAAKTSSAASHNVTITRMLITVRRRERESKATVVTGRGSAPGGVCAPIRRWPRRGTTVTGRGFPLADSWAGAMRPSPEDLPPVPAALRAGSLTLPPPKPSGTTLAGVVISAATSASAPPCCTQVAPSRTTPRGEGTGARSRARRRHDSAGAGNSRGMTTYGYFLSCEEFTPAQLVEQARMAERAGFEALWI